MFRLYTTDILEFRIDEIALELKVSPLTTGTQKPSKYTNIC